MTANLASGAAQLHHAYIVRDGAGEEHYGEVVVTGPRLTIEEPAATTANR